MDAQTLRKWLAEKRGRAPLIADEQGMSRQFVHQMARGIRPIPSWLHPYLNRIVTGDYRGKKK